MNKPRGVGLSSQAHVLSISSFPHPFSKWECLHLKLFSENSPEARDLTLPAQPPPVFSHLRGRQPSSLTAPYSSLFLYATPRLLSFSSMRLLIVTISQGAVLGCHCPPIPAIPASLSWEQRQFLPSVTPAASVAFLWLPNQAFRVPLLPSSVCEAVFFFSTSISYQWPSFVTYNCNSFTILFSFLLIITENKNITSYMRLIK